MRKCARCGARFVWNEELGLCGVCEETTRSCSVDGCIRPSRARGMCATHYGRWHASQPRADVPRRVRGACTVDGCDGPHYARGLCRMHYTRQWRQQRATTEGSEVGT